MIKTDFSIIPTEENFKRLLGKSAERMLRSKRARSDFEAVKQDFLDLVDPQVAWNRFGIKKITDVKDEEKLEVISHELETLIHDIGDNLNKYCIKFPSDCIENQH